MPDHYTVALEVSRARTTQAWTETCSTVDARPCFHGVDVGQSFIRRDLNEPCNGVVRRSSFNIIMMTFIRQWRQKHTVTRNRMDRRQTDLLKLQLWKDTQF